MNAIQCLATPGTEWTAGEELARIARMGRYRFTAFVNDGNPRYVVLWDLQWKPLQCHRLEATVNLRAAMDAAVDALAAQGWQVEGSLEYGFVFLSRGAERRLLMLTPRNPENRLPQTFSPFRR